MEKDLNKFPILQRLKKLLTKSLQITKIKSQLIVAEMKNYSESSQLNFERKNLKEALMKKSLLIICLVLTALFSSIYAQQGTVSQTGTSTAVDREQNMMRARAERAERIKRDQDFNRVRAAGNQASVSNNSSKNPAAPVKLSKEQEKRRRPDAEDLAKFADFLKLPQTGLFKLFPNTGCFSHNTVRIGEDCQNAMPLSSIYSFQKKDYAVQIAEIGLKDDTFFSRGLLVNSLLVTLGDVPLETVSLNSDGVKFLADYQSASNNQEILAKQKELADGIKEGNYQYGASASVLENTTYAVRVIGYQGKIMLPLGDSGTSYNLLEKDKRADIIVVFRTVRKSADGSLTILWKQLQRKDSPKIKLSEEEQQRYLSGFYFQN